MGDRHAIGPKTLGQVPGSPRAGSAATVIDEALAARPVPAVPAAVAAAPARPWRFHLTVEQGLYGLLVILAVLTRFWDLGSRTLHHDESLHTYYSWLYATGQGYEHDPLMHGPFLFHAVALAYLLLGDSEVTSRLMPAISGVVLVWLPYLLRGPRLLGRWGALAASALILISPALWYQSRYLRHDAFTLVGTLLLFIAIVRYIEKPERRWLITIGITLPCLIANHEIIFGLLAVFGGMLGLALLWGRLRPITPVVIVTGVALLAAWLILPGLLAAPFPDIPWQNPTQENQFEFYRELGTHPALIASVLVLIVGVAASALILQRRRDPALAEEGFIPSLLGGATPGTVEHAVDSLWRDRAGLTWMIWLSAIIGIVLFTSLFTNLYGLATATVATDGTLLYWLGQHDYRRGEQPWFYYLLLLPQYEFIAVLLGLAAAVLIGIRTLLVALRRRYAQGVPGTRPGPRFFFQLFLLAWFAGILAGLSWAGEKMPWLMTHITLPATLLAAVLIGELVEHGLAGLGVRRRWALPEWALTGGLLIVGAGWFLLAVRLTYGEFVPSAAAGGWERTVTPWVAERWWWLALPPLAALLILGAGLIWRGARRTGLAALLALVVTLAGLQVHAGWRLIYQEGDVPRDMMVYTQTSPDVSRMMRELALFSAELTGGTDLEIWYDNNQGVSWPLQWYLRDYPNRHMFGGSLSAPPSNVPVLIVGSSNNSGVLPYLSGYTAQEYVLRWWFPESVYRDFAIAPELPPGRSALDDASDPQGPLAILASMGESLAALGTMEGQQDLFRLVMFRDLPEPIGRFTYTMYIRDDLVPLFNTIRY